QKLKIKNFDATEVIEGIISCDKERRELQSSLDDTLGESKKIAKSIGQLYKEGKAEEANKLKEKTTELKTLSKEFSTKLEEKKELQNSLLLQIPNIPHPTVKGGKSDADNEIFQDLSDKSILEEDSVPHWDLTDKYDIVDFDLGSKITGAGFPVYKGKGARLQRALINFFLDQAIEAGYHEIQPPLLINEASGLGTGQLPDKEGQMYEVPGDKLFLIPTAEIPVTNIYRDVIVKETDFPLKNVAYSNCFRREAGSYGKDVRGLNRLHQFDKVEIVQIQHPEKSYNTLNEMVEYVKGLLTKLELPFRVLRLCGGDLSFTAALTFDLEVYAKGQKRWLEVSSVSNFETYQANRMKLRYKDSNGKSQLAHTLNGSALALPRIVAALLENNYTEKGIKIPKALVPYTKFEYID
ncbi:MAG: serine--tRNA ligase, partial [Bacteroidota bacterium]|nr:serine--tRNA ligase [Bacteroidota bacterium]